MTNADGAGTASPSQGDPQLSQSGVNAAPSGNSNSNNSNGNNGNHGIASNGDVAQGPDPDVNHLEKLVFICDVRGGTLAQ